VVFPWSTCAMIAIFLNGCIKLLKTCKSNIVGCINVKNA
jgi:hypothetical protein